MQSELCTEVGLDRIELEMQQDTSKAQLDADLQQGQNFGIDGVPFMVFQSRFSIAGAHPPDTLLNVIDAAIQDD